MEAKLPDRDSSDFTNLFGQGCTGHRRASAPFGQSRAHIPGKLVNNTLRVALGDSAEIIDGMPWFNETVFDSGLIADLRKDKKVEVSIGFETEIDPTPGELNGERYDCVQRKIKINHVAHLEKGRAGETVRAYLDSAIPDGLSIAVMQDKKQQETDMKKPDQKHDENAFLEGMKRFFALFSRQDDLAAAATAVQTATTQALDTPAPATPDDTKSLNEQIILLRAQVDALQALLGEKQRQLQEATQPAAMDSAIAERMELMELARACVPDFKHDGLKNRDIKLRVIEKLLPFKTDVKIDGLADAVIDARFDAAASIAREKAATREDSTPASRLDEAAIEKKRAAGLPCTSRNKEDHHEHT